MAEYTIPPLTTVRMSCKDLAFAAVVTLLGHLNPADAPPASLDPIPTRLIVRQTTGAPRRTERTSNARK
jgi:LacI family transcriptional regulator